MANRRFPRNNNRNNSRSNNYRNNNAAINCPQCNQRINILNDDVQYSLNLHYMQSHRSLDNIQQDVDRNLSRARIAPNHQRNVQSNYKCPECGENVQVFDNDVTGALRRHAQKHQRSDMGARADDQSSTSSGRSRNSNKRQNYVRNNIRPKPDGMILLDSIFYKMQPGLKAHRGFVFENESGEVVCGLCQFKIDSLNQISDHLVTKSHEDNTISFIKSKLPYELVETMNFVSFYGSNLCCNLCRCKIDLNSINLSETIMNIIVHNAGQEHVRKKGKNEPLDHSKEGTKKLNFLASIHSLINNNKHVISCEMQPQFKCTLCDKLITFDQNDQILLKNFTSHFSSNGHNKCVRATSVLTTFKRTYQSKGGKHNLVVTKGSVTCTVCNISMEPTLETLDAHVKEIDSSANIDWPEDLSDRINRLDFTGPQQPFEMREQNNESGASKLSKVNALLKCMPPSFRNVDYVVESGQGHVTCLVCNCVIPSTFYNLKTHLTGASHMKNLSSTKEEIDEARSPNNSHTTVSASSQNFNPFMKENSSPPMKVMGEFENDMGNALDYLKNGDSLIRKNVSLLTKHSNNLYSCKLCQMTIPKSDSIELLKQNLITHLSCSNHEQLFDSKIESEIAKMMTVDPLVNANKLYLHKLKESLLCTVCDITLTISIDAAKLKKSVTEHLKGQQHQSNVKKTADKEAQKPAVFLSNSIESLKTEYQFSKANEFTNRATKSSSNVQVPVEQFEGPPNLSKSDQSTSKSQKSSFLVPSPTELHKKQMVNVTPNEINFELPKLTFPNSTSTDIITEQFRKLPLNFQSDIAFITKSCVIEGYLACTLCSNNHINPPYLQKHLEEEKHMQNKIARRSTSAKGDIQNSTSSKPSSSYLLNPTEPRREQPINITLKESNFELPKSTFPNLTTTDIITELFRKLPANFQPDIAFINKGSLEGQLECSLCGINNINPCYLQNHLETEKHLQNKIVHQPLSTRKDTQNSASSKKMMHSMKNFFGFN